MAVLPWIAAFFAALCAAGAAYAAASAARPRNGWRNGGGPVARWLDARRRARFDEQLPDALGTMSNALRAGFSLSQAFDSVVDQGDRPISEEFAIFQGQLRVGMPFEDALASLSARVGSEDLSLAATAILASRRTGGNVTEVFDRISDTIRSRMKVERKVKTLTAQGRMQGVVVSLMPLVLGILMTLVKPGMMIPFFCSALGAVSILATLLLIAAGWLMILRITKIDV